MRRRKTAKARVKPSKRNARKGAGVRAAAAKDTDVAQIQRERDEALHQQAATAEILKLISSSPADTQPVFEAIVRNGLKLFPDAAIFIALPDGDRLRAAAFVATDPNRAEMWARRWPIPLTREYMHSLAFLDRKTVDMPDAREPPPELAVGAKNFLPTGYRALTIMPMMRGRTAIGTLSVVRLAPGPLSDRQVAALKTYAAQAVIAIENTRLLNELRQRTDDLSESLEQQTATSEVLKVISSSPGDLEPIFQVMLANATRICGAKFGVLFRYEDGAFHPAAMLNAPQEFVEFHRQRGSFQPPAGSPLDRLLKTGGPVYTADEAAEPKPGAPARLGGARSLVAVPMRKESRLVGAIIIYHQEVRPFSDKQIELLTNFADQAVIAIENTRLLNELRQRTDDLSESLEQQTATSEVLQVISRSPGELVPVFETILENAVGICGASFGVLFRWENDAWHASAMHGVPPAFAEFWQRGPQRPSPRTALGRLAITKQAVHIADVTTEPAYIENESIFVAAVNLGGFRTILNIPMLKDDVLIGAIAIYRTEANPFSEKQCELLTNFASQAVIAIENTRLLSELRESLQQQTATADVLKVISRSTFDLETVLDTLTGSAARLCQANKGAIFAKDGETYRLAAHFGFSPDEAQLARQYATEEPLRPGRGSLVGRVAMDGRVVHIGDVLTDAEYEASVYQKAFGYRSNLGVPLLRDGAVVGVFALMRTEVNSFSEKEIELVSTFADQAVIAIENTRLLSELRESLQQQTATSDVLKVISRSTFDLQTVLDTLVESAARLCGAEMANIWRPREGGYRLTASYGVTARYKEYLENKEFLNTVVIEPGRGTMVGRVLLETKTVHIHDIQADADYKLSGLVELGGYRTMLGVPILREGQPIGVFVLVQSEVRPFTDKQIDLATTFADQAAIAIENVRLFDEVQTRTRDLSESLQQQTATADVLKVISRSTFDLQPVLDTLTESAAQLCDAEIAAIIREKGDAYFWATSYGLTPGSAEALAATSVAMKPGRATVAGRVLQEGKTVHLPDVLMDPEYQALDIQQVVGFRAILGVPLMRAGAPIGIILLMRRAPKPFTDKQIELAETFADQAVIAIENVRLFDEVQTRTRDLAEALQQQTATADVLKTISRSAFDLPTVLDALIETAARMSDADQGAITREIDGAFFRAATYGYSAAFSDFIHSTPVQMDRSSIAGRALVEGRIVQIADVKADPDYTFSPGLDSGDFRTALGVPMLREGVPIGALSLTRKDVRPFTGKQIELVTTFADQAAIAIANVRLFDEVQGRTRELAASLEELRNTQDRLVQTQKLASLGQLTAGIAHEIKNPLNFVNNFSAISTELIDELQDTLKGISFDSKRRAEVDELTATLRGNLEKVVQHGKRADAIVKNMLLHSREGSGEHRLVDINTLVEESLTLAYHGARAEKQGFNITLERSFDAGAGTADLFPQEITRVLLNLIVNGFYAATKRKAEAGGNGYEPTLTAATRSLGDSVEISIRDNGTGIPPDVKEKIFNPFFTTKPAGEGTGLGLSLSHDIVVKQHGGSIEVDTRPGEFTEFRVILPRGGAALAKTE